jgi:hypothetical protein
MATRKKRSTARVRRAPKKTQQKAPPIAAPASEREALLKTVAACAGKIEPAAATVEQIRGLLSKKGYRSPPLYASAEDFFAELYQNLGEGRLAYVADHAGPLPSGLERVRTGLLSHLDFSFQHRPVTLLCGKARLLFPRVAVLFDQRNAGAALMISVEFSAMRWPHPAELARLVHALLTEVMTTEMLDGEVHPKLRELLLASVEALAPRTAGAPAQP